MNSHRTLMFAVVILSGACVASPGVESVEGTGGAGAGSGTAGAPGGGDGGGDDASGASADLRAGLAPTRPPGGGGGIGGSTDGPAAPEDATCAATMADAVPVPVDIFIMLDVSGSMNDPAMAGGLMTKWEAAKTALAAFVQSPATAGLNVGMGFFPITTPSGFLRRSVCMPAAYAMPVTPMAPLPGAGADIIGRLNMTTPVGGTPTNPALQGAIEYAQAWQNSSGRRAAIALVTDGQPNDCASSVQAVSATAMTAAATGLLTFVVGVGPQLQNLNAIASAGGTNMAYLVDTGSVDGFIAALTAIQSQAAKLACTFAIPPTSGGAVIDPAKVNVSFSPNGNPATATTLNPVANRGACGPAGGWYYDNPLMPSTVSLCPATCQIANSSPMARVSLLFGCKTTVIE